MRTQVTVGLLWALLAPDQAGAACLADDTGYFTGRLRGALELDLEWRGEALDCETTRRPDGQGLRFRFTADLAGGGKLTLVLAPPMVPAEPTGQPIPFNLTVVEEPGGRIFGTRGTGQCLLELRATTGPAGPIETLGYCLGPARSLTDGQPLLLTTFDFRAPPPAGLDSGS
ncbi:MAG: hypothetical protein ACO213_00080 [Steroidobacteraceae bacterium]